MLGLICFCGLAEAFVGRQPTDVKSFRKESFMLQSSNPADFPEKPEKNGATSEGPDSIVLLKNKFPVEIQEFSVSNVLENFESIKQNVLQGELGGRGEIYFGLQVALLFCILLGNVPLVGKVVFGVMGPTLLIAGLAVSLLTASRLGQSLSPWPVPTDNTTLLTDGFFGLVRHPIYAGLLSACFGFSIVTESAIRFCLTLLLLYLLDLKSNYEEQALMSKFGSDIYQDYQRKVPSKFLPQAFVEVLPWKRSAREGSPFE